MVDVILGASINSYCGIEEIFGSAITVDHRTFGFAVLLVL